MSQIKHKKSLGQHFLNDNMIINNIIQSCGDIENKNILEIGPGQGALTNHLVLKSKSLFAIEKDERLKIELEMLKNKHSNFNFEMLDALKFPSKDILSNINILVSNLPYNVGTQILLNYLILNYEDNRINIEKFILMFQKEVALRVTASINSKHYGRLSIICNLLAKTKMLFDVPKESFSPPPAVMSAVVSLEPLEKPLYDVNLKSLSHVTSIAFNGKRKTIRNSMMPLGINLENLDINTKKRAQELSIEEFCRVANAYDELQRT